MPVSTYKSKTKKGKKDARNERCQDRHLDNKCAVGIVRGVDVDEEPYVIQEGATERLRIELGAANG